MTDTGPKKSYLILNNIGKSGNWGTLLRSAAAFGVTDIFVVGGKKIQTFGNQGTTLHVNLVNFDSLEELKEHLVQKNIMLCGIEIHPESVPVQTHPFSNQTAFMLGNEGVGMNEQQMAVCDKFVYIPQHSGATASLNVATAGAIVLHHFAMWAALPEQNRTDYKFDVCQGRTKLDRFTNPSEYELIEQERKRTERAAKRLKQFEEADCNQEENTNEVVE